MERSRVLRSNAWAPAILSEHEAVLSRRKFGLPVGAVEVIVRGDIHLANLKTTQGIPVWWQVERDRGKFIFVATRCTHRG